MAKTAKIAAGFGVGAAALTAVVLATPGADAASDMTFWEHGNSRFEMTVSDTTPSVGDTITISNTFQRKWSDEYIYSVKYVVPSCLNYVAGSGHWNGGQVSSVDDQTDANPAFALINAPGVTSWNVPGLGGGFGEKRTASMKFKVTAACATGNANQLEMHYGGSLGDGIYKTQPPKFTVAKGSTTTTTTPTTSTTNPTTSTTNPTTSTTNPTTSTTKPTTSTTNPTGTTTTNPTGTTTQPTGTTTVPTATTKPTTAPGGSSGSLDTGSLGSLFG